MKPRIALLIAALVLTAGFGTAARAQQDAHQPRLIVQDTVMSLDSLIQIGIDNQATYRKAVEGERIVSALNRSAIGQFLPGVTAGMNLGNSRYITSSTYVEGIAFGGQDKKSSSSSWNLNVSESLFEGGSRYWGYKSAKLQIQNTFLTTERSQDMLIAQVKTAYFNLLASQDNLNVQNEVLQQRLEAQRLAKARYATGDVIELDVMQADIDVGNQQNVVLQAQQSVDNAREALNLTVGLSLDSRYPVQGDLKPNMPEMQQDSLVSTALEYRPDFLAQQNLVKMREYDLKSNTSEYLPSASLYYQVRRSQTIDDVYNNFSLNPSDQKVTSFGLSLNWTLFDRFNREYSRQNAYIAKRQAKLDEINQRLQIDANVR